MVGASTCRPVAVVRVEEDGRASTVAERPTRQIDALLLSLSVSPSSLSLPGDVVAEDDVFQLSVARLAALNKGAFSVMPTQIQFYMRFRTAKSTMTLS